MDAGKLNTKVKVQRLTLNSDGFGGFTSTQATIGTFWANVDQKAGEISQENGIRERRLEIEIVFRKKTADQILDSDVLEIENEAGQYRINERLNHVQRFYTTIKATKIAQ